MDDKPKVVVVGVHDNKKVFLEREYNKVFDLQLLTPDDSPDRFFFTGKAMHVFVMRDFVNHLHTTTLTKHRIPFTLVAGSVSALRRHLDKLLKG